MVIVAAVANTGQCPLFSARSTANGANIVNPRKITKIPITYPTGRISIMAVPLIAVTVSVKSYKNYPRWTSVVNSWGSIETVSKVEPSVKIDIAS